MKLAKETTHMELKLHIYENILAYSCHNSNAEALHQVLLADDSSDTIVALLSRPTLRFGNYALSCIQEAAKCGRNTFLSMMLEHLPSDSVLPYLLEPAQGDGGKTALHMACDNKWHKFNLVKTIIDGVPKDDQFELIIATDHCGNTVLHSAVARGDESLVLALKMHQLTDEQQFTIMEKKNNERLRAIDLAKQQRNQKIEQYLDDLLRESNISKHSK